MSNSLNNATSAVKAMTTGRKPLRRISSVLPWLLLVALTTGTLLWSFQSWNQNRANSIDRFATVAATEKRLAIRFLDRNQQLLQSLATYASSMPRNSPPNWPWYMQRIKNQVAVAPGLYALAYVPATKFNKRDVANLLPGSGADDPATRAKLNAILNQLALNTAYQETLALALANNRAALSRVIEVDTPTKIKLLLMVEPVYQNAPPQQINTTAYALALIDYDKFIDSVAAESAVPIKLALLDPARTEQIDSGAGKMHSIEKFAYGLRDWQLSIHSTPQLDEQLASPLPVFILVVCLIGTLLLVGLVWLLSRVREQAENMATRMTTELRDQNKFTEDLIEFNPNPIFRKDLQGRYQAVNRAWEKMSGYPRNDVIGKTASEIEPEAVSATIEAAERILYSHPDGALTQPSVLVNPQGESFDTIISTAVVRNSEGEVEGLLGTLTDVTQLKNLEREVEHQREQLDLVIRSSQQGVWDIELKEDGERYFSDRFKEMLGYRIGDEFPDLFNPAQVVHADDREAFKTALALHLKGKTPLFNFETRVRRTDRNYVWVLTRGIAQRDRSGRAIRFTGSISDITDRKNAEFNLLEANKKVVETAQAKEAFLATMSHEIRTPLNGVLGMTSLLSDTPLTEEQRDYIRVIRASGDTLLRLIDDVLDFSKIESGRMTLESVPVEILSIAEEALELVSEKAREKQLQLIYEIADDVPNYIMGDATRLRQILLNLFSNAIKFTQEGHIHLRIGLGNVMSPKFELVCSVSDSGLGIPADRVNKLFQPFTQVDASTTRKYGGTGLGLAICKRLTNLMGGDISVTSEEGKGSVFKFFIVTESARGRLKPHMQRGVSDFEDKRVLYIDHFAPRREVLTMAMRRWGLKVVSCDYQQAANQLSSAGPFDAILTNMLNPDEASLAFADALVRVNQSRSLPIPVILISRFQRAEITEAGLQLPVPHQFMLVRTLPRNKLFDALIRAVNNLGFADASTRPYSNEPVYDADFQRLKDVRETAPPRAAADLKSIQKNPELVSSDKPQVSRRLLVAEDNEVNQRVVTGMLKNLGHHLTLVGNGREAVAAAVAAAEAEPFDLILMDIHMPELDGMGATKEIRNQLAGKICPPIVAMTAHALAGDRENYLQLGMDEYISKPIKLDALSQVIDRALALSPAQRQVNLTPAIQSQAANMPDSSINAIPILDIEQLEELRYLPASTGGTNDADDPVGGLIRLFLEKTKERMVNMKSQLDTLAWAPLAEVAHSLRGSSASMGFSRVAALSKQIELASRERVTQPNLETPDIGALFVALQGHYAEAEMALAEWIKSTPGK